MHPTRKKIEYNSNVGKDEKREAMQKSVTKYCNHSSYPTRATSHAFVRLFLDLLLRAACKSKTKYPMD